jgi:hypothetical protein
MSPPAGERPIMSHWVHGWKKFLIYANFRFDPWPGYRTGCASNLLSGFGNLISGRQAETPRLCVYDEGPMKESCTDRGLERALIYSALGIRLSRRRKGSSETMAAVDNVHRGRVRLRP